MINVAARIVIRSSARLPRPRAIQWRDHDAADRYTHCHEGETEQQPVLELDPTAPALERRIAVTELIDGVRAAAQAEADELRPDHDEQRATDQRVDVEAVPEERRAREDEQHQEEADRADERSGEQEQEVRVVDQHQAQRAPTVLERRQLRLSLPRMEGDRHLADLEAAPGRSDHHLRGELHAGRLQVEHREDIAPERSHAAPRVADRSAEEQVEEARHERVADAAQHGHRAGLDGVHPVPHDQLGTAVELLDEARDLLEVVREVGVDHHDVVALGLCEAGEVGAAVAAPRLVHDPGAGETGEDAAAVVGTVVDDDHFAVELGVVEHAPRRVHALADALRLVQAGDDDRDEDGVARRRRLPLRKDANRHARYLRRRPAFMHPPTGLGPPTL